MRGHDVVTLVEGGYLRGASFGFLPVKEKWSYDRNLEVERVNVTHLRLAEISVVGDPAYPDTTAAVRSRDLAIRAGEYVDPRGETPAEGYETREELRESMTSEMREKAARRLSVMRATLRGFELTDNEEGNHAY